MITPNKKKKKKGGSSRRKSRRRRLRRRRVVGEFAFTALATKILLEFLVLLKETERFLLTKRVDDLDLIPVPAEPSKADNSKAPVRPDFPGRHRLQIRLDLV